MLRKRGGCAEWWGLSSAKRAGGGLSSAKRAGGGALVLGPKGRGQSDVACAEGD